MLILVLHPYVAVEDMVMWASVQLTYSKNNKYIRGQLNNLC